MSKKIDPKNWKILPFLPLGVLTVGLSITIIYLIKSSTTKNIEDFITKEEPEDNPFDKLVIFPTFNHYDFYEDLRIENQKVIISQEMIAKIINYVINQAQISYGTIKYDYKILSSQMVHLTFSWSIDNQIYKHSYLFNILH